RLQDHRLPAWGPTSVEEQLRSANARRSVVTRPMIGPQAPSANHTENQSSHPVRQRSDRGAPSARRSGATWRMGWLVWSLVRLAAERLAQYELEEAGEIVVAVVGDREQAAAAALGGDADVGAESLPED